MKFKSTVIDFNSVKQTVTSKRNKKLNRIKATITLDEDILDLMKNEFDYYLNKEIEVFKDGNSKE